MKKLVLFDFDGTLTHKDTMFDFLKFVRPDLFWMITISFAPLFLLARMGVLSTSWVKQNYIAAFIKGKTRHELQQLANTYFNRKHETLLRKKALEYINQLPPNTKKIIVSASMDIWLTPFAKHLKCDLICTMAKFDSSDVFTGTFATPNCNYYQKKLRVQDTIRFEDFDEIIVFGNTKGDAALSQLATRYFHRHFH